MRKDFLERQYDPKLFRLEYRKGLRTFHHIHSTHTFKSYYSANFDIEFGKPPLPRFLLLILIVSNSSEGDGGVGGGL